MQTEQLVRTSDAPRRSARLNQSCFCVSVDRDALRSSLEREAAELDFSAHFISARQHLFSNTPVFLPRSSVTEMQSIVAAIEAASKLEGYRKAALFWAAEIAQVDHGPVGAFMGYDFHLDETGPKLIEINTNAGGAFLNALLALHKNPAVPSLIPHSAKCSAMTLKQTWL